MVKSATKILFLKRYQLQIMFKKILSKFSIIKIQLKKMIIKDLMTKSRFRPPASQNEKRRTFLLKENAMWMYQKYQNFSQERL